MVKKSQNCSTHGRRGSKKTFLLPTEKWLGVNASKSLRSELNAVNCFAFNVYLTTHIVVDRTISLITRFPNAKRFQNSTKWGAAGGLNIHLTSFWNIGVWNPPLFHATMYSSNSVLVPKNCVPLSLNIVVGLTFCPKTAYLHWDNYLCLTYILFLTALLSQLGT